jgi:hypothetical protein
MRTDPGSLTFAPLIVGAAILASAPSSQDFALATGCFQEAAEQRWFSVESAAFTGDFDADGATDVLVGAPYEFADHGMVRVYSGRTGEQIREIPGPSGETDFGCAVAVLGDVTGDGRCDFLVGSTQRWPPEKGKVRLYSGADGILVHTLESGNDQSRFGLDLALAPAADAASQPRLLLSCYLVGEMPKQYTPAFACYEIGTWQRLWTASVPAKMAAEAGESFSCAAGGHLDDDAWHDYLVSFRDDHRERRMRALSGRDGSTLWEIGTDAQLGSLNESYSSFDDVDRDQRNEVLASRLFHNRAQGVSDVLTLCILSGKDGTDMCRFPSKEFAPFSDPCGAALAQIESMDGDEVADISIHTFAFPDKTKTVILSGASGELLLDIPLVPHLTWPGTDNHELITGGDANADGTPDVVVRVFSNDASGFTDEGIHVYSGRDGKELFHKTCRSETPSACDE